MAEKKSERSVYDEPSLRREFVDIKNGRDTARVTRAAFEQVWRERGWTDVDDKKSTTTNTGDGPKEKS
jgi:hypothetical protein